MSYSLRNFKTYFEIKHVKILSDSQVWVQIINKMWTIKSSVCNDIVMILSRIFGFFVSKINLDNCNKRSRYSKCDCRLWIIKSYKDTEWMLNLAIFQKAINQLKSESNLNCFASRLNTQLPKYISYKQNPHVYLIDEFSVHWALYSCYLFPHFSLIGRTVSKDSHRSNRSYSCSSKVANTALVQQSSLNGIPGNICGDPIQRKSTSTTKTRGTAPLVAEANTSEREFS